MISKLVKGTRFDALLLYLARKRGATLLDRSHGLDGGEEEGAGLDLPLGDDRREGMAQGLLRTARLSSRVRKPLLHVSLALRPGESLTADDWRAVCQGYLRGMGLEGCHFVAFRHVDTEHEHVHLAVCRVHPRRGTVVSDSWDWLRSARVCRQLEEVFGLTRVRNPWEVPQVALKTGEMRAWRRTGRRPARARLREVVMREMQGARSLEEGVARLRARGLEVRARLLEGRAVGWSIAINGIPFRARDLDRRLAMGALKRCFQRRLRERARGCARFLEGLAIEARKRGAEGFVGRALEVELVDGRGLRVRDRSSGRCLLEFVRNGRDGRGDWVAIGLCDASVIERVEAAWDKVQEGWMDGRDRALMLE